MDKILKILFVLEGDFVPSWYAETISAIVKSKTHQLYFLRLPENKVKKHSPLLIHRLFSKFEDYWFTQEFDALKMLSVLSILNKYQNEVRCINDNFSLGCEKELKELELDVIYTPDLNSEIKNRLATFAKFGVWHIQFGREGYQNNNLPGFWEVMDNDVVTGAYLLMRKYGVDYILYEGVTTSVPYSVKNNFSSIAFKASSFAVHRVKTLAHFDSSFPKVYNKKFNKTGLSRKVKGNLDLLRLIIKNFFRYILYKIRSYRGDRRFGLLYCFKPFDLLNFYSQAFTQVGLPGDRFFADPFIIKKGSTHYIFFEEYHYSKGKGQISCISLRENSEPSVVTTVLEKYYHLSYPFVFPVDEELFMIPETSEIDTVELYRATSFPYAWEKVMNLFEDRKLIDCTVIFYSGIWWLFANSSDHPFVSTNDQLFLYYSNHLLSKNWTPHPLNPIVTDISNCRPAGRIFEQNGKLFRPAQNNASSQYGYGININEIEVLTTENYVEKQIVRTDPNILQLRAIHQIDFNSELVVIDGIKFS